jgi:hypothetical protein
MPLGKSFVKRFVVVFLNYYIFSRRPVGHALQPVWRAFQAFRGFRDLSIVLVGRAGFDFGRGG